MGVEYVKEKTTFSQLLFIRLRSPSTRVEHAHYYFAVAVFFCKQKYIYHVQEWEISTYSYVVSNAMVFTRRHWKHSFNSIGKLICYRLLLNIAAHFNRIK